jgi:hypothetical protein
MLKKGKLYRVTNHAVSGDRQLAHIATAHGWLWVFEGEYQHDANDYPLLRSVATGDVTWFRQAELEAADAEEG